jgi:hypothetical protein
MSFGWAYIRNQLPNESPDGEILNPPGGLWGLDFSIMPLADEDREHELQVRSADWLSRPGDFFGITRIKRRKSGHVRFTGWFNIKLLLLWGLGRGVRKMRSAALWIIEGYSRPYALPF